MRFTPLAPGHATIECKVTAASGDSGDNGAGSVEAEAGGNSNPLSVATGAVCIGNGAVPTHAMQVSRACIPPLLQRR